MKLKFIELNALQISWFFCVRVFFFVGLVLFARFSNCLATILIHLESILTLFFHHFNSFIGRLAQKHLK